MSPNRPPPARPTARASCAPAWRQRPLLALATALALLGAAAPSSAAGLASAAVQAASGQGETAFDGVVEAMRQTIVAAQVSGAVVQLGVAVGDRVTAGQVLVRLDARAADQTAAAGDAQVQAARASLEAARQDVERQRQLFQKNYISQAALDQAESRYKTTQAQVNAQQAQAGATRTQTGFYVVRAPFAGVVSELPVSLGDMALPGRPLLTLYDPSALRVSAAVPQSIGTALAPGMLPRVELPGAATGFVQPLRTQVLPTIDPTTHTVQVRAELPPQLSGVAPGMYARLWLPVTPDRRSGAAAPLTVPRAAVVRRAELTALYVLDANGQPQLRQVRLGRAEGDRVEVLAGLMPAEQVASDPQAAARQAATTPSVPNARAR